MRSALILILAAFAGVAQAQSMPTVRAYVEPDTVMIGDRFDYVIDVEKDLAQEISFPLFDSIKEQIELYKELPIDTIEREGRRLKLRKRYRFAAFEEGRFNLGKAGVLYADKNIIDTLFGADSILLYVNTYAIDSTSQSIYDLKNQIHTPFRFREIRGYTLWALAILALLGVGYWLLVRYLALRGKRIGDLFKSPPPPPAHVVAIKALEELHHQKLWQNSRYKLYYSSLTDILRTYIASRWGIGAMEMTSDEILEAMRSEELPTKASMDLQAVLQSGDLVKFAKATPDAEHNEADYLKVYYFVEETKQVEVTDDEQNRDDDE